MFGPIYIAAVLEGYQVRHTVSASGVDTLYTLSTGGRWICCGTTKGNGRALWPDGLATFPTFAAAEEAAARRRDP